MQDNQNNKNSSSSIWIVVLVIFAVAYIAYGISQTKAKNDYQNAVDYTACRKDYKNGLATMDECDKVKSNGYIYVPK